jgi:hypothetical protein
MKYIPELRATKMRISNIKLLWMMPRITLCHCCWLHPKIIMPRVKPKRISDAVAAESQQTNIYHDMVLDEVNKS